MIYPQAIVFLTLPALDDNNEKLSQKISPYYYTILSNKYVVNDDDDTHWTRWITKLLSTQPTTQFDIYIWKGVEAKTESVNPRERGMNEWRIEI